MAHSGCSISLCWMNLTLLGMAYLGKSCSALEVKIIEDSVVKKHDKSSVGQKLWIQETGPVYLWSKEE